MNVCILKMLYFDRTDVNKANASKEFHICHYWYFLNYSFNFQPNISNRCHDLLFMSVKLNNIAILSIKCSYYHCIIRSISKKYYYKLIAKCWFHQKKLSIIKHEQFIFIYKNW